MPADFENDILLVTSANGKQAAHLIPFLLPKWHQIRLVVKSDSSRDALLKAYKDTSTPAGHAVEVVQANLAQPDDCHRILKDVRAVYHIGPSFHPRETEIGYEMIDAAFANRVQHFVYSSVLHPILRKLINHDCKRYVEEYLIESGLQYTILQPSHFMDMFPIRQLISNEKPVYTARWDADVPFSYTSLHDLGEAAANVLEQRETHFFATYQMVSTSSPIGYRQVCGIASRVIGKEINVQVMPFQQTIDQKVESMFGLEPNAYTRDTAQRMLLYYSYRGLVGNNNSMRSLLGREPTQWESWIKRVLDETKGDR